MEATDFPQANTRFGPPPGLDESQVFAITGYVGEVQRGNMEGSPVCIVAWRPSEEDLLRLNAGGPVFLSMLGGLCPHFLTTEFPKDYA